MLKAFKEWRKRRYWEKRHLEFIRQHVARDARWLSVDPKCRAIMDRMEAITNPDWWYRTLMEDISDFRRRIGSEPDYKTGPSEWKQFAEIDGEGMFYRTPTEPPKEQP